MKCRYDRDVENYLIDGEPCRVDDYGDPTRHCTARRTCSVHIGPDELTCPRCIGRTRADITWITNLAALMPTEALSAGVASEAANLAGPAAQPHGWSERRLAMLRHLDAWLEAARITEQQWISAHANMPEEDTHHPLNVLGRWVLMLAEDYGHEIGRLDIGTAAAYLDRNLARVANDPEQDWALLSRELRKCRTHLEAVLANSRASERGAPCPTCTSDETGVGPRLVRRYAHWCNDEACEKVHYDDDSGDVWICPRDQAHWWTHEDYERWVETRRKKKSA